MAVFRVSGRVVRGFFAPGPFKPEAKFDPGRRPAGWVGHWSTQYGRVLAYTLTEDPPFQQPVREVIASAPQPLREALDPVASAAEPADRDGRRLSWRWARSTTADLFGRFGVALGCVSAAIMIWTIVAPRLDLPPLFLSDHPAKIPVNRDSTTSNQQGPAQSAPQAPAPPQGAREQTAPAAAPPQVQAVPQSPAAQAAPQGPTESAPRVSKVPQSPAQQSAPPSAAPERGKPRS
jgi:hypothetical protein